jgi:proton-translocating NADH-quinone oxidoreductase chain M
MDFSVMLQAAQVSPLTLFKESPNIAYILFALAAGSLLVLLADRWSSKLSGALTSAFLSLMFVLSMLVPISGTYFTLFSTSYIGNVRLFSDGMSALMIIVTLGLSAAIAVYATGFFEVKRKGFFTAYLVLVTSLIGIFSSANLLLLFLFLELLLISGWSIIGIWGGERRGAAALKYFIYKESSAILILIGILILGGILGTFDILSITTSLAITPTLAAAISLIVAGVLIKSAVFPLHDWLPDAYFEAPYPATSILSYITVAVGAYTLVRIFYSVVPNALNIPNLKLILILLGLVNIFYGSITSISQSNLKRLLAYSSISQVGFVLIGVASGSLLGFFGAMLFSIAHGLAKSSLFMVSGVYKKELGTEELPKISGLAGRMPITSSALLASFLSLAGIPPLLGFWGEIFIFLPFAYSLVGQSLNLASLALLIVAVVSTVFTAGYGLWVTRRALYGQSNEVTEKARDPSPLLWLPIISFVVLLCIFGLYPNILSHIFWIINP